MSEARTTDELADAIFDAIERGDVDLIESVWADDVEVWHNNDDLVQNKEQNLAVLAWMIKKTASREYLDIVRDITTSGFAQRHVLRLTFDDGRVRELPAAIFFAVSDGRVKRIDEYLDSAHIAAAFGS